MRKKKITRGETIIKKNRYELRKRRTQKDPPESKTYGNELKKRRNPPSWKKCEETIIEKKHYELRKRKKNSEKGSKKSSWLDKLWKKL